MRNLAKTQIRIYKMSLKFLGDIFVFIWSPQRVRGGGTYVHHETRLLACVKTADLLTTTQFSDMTCVKNVLSRTSSIKKVVNLIKETRLTTGICLKIR